MATKEIAIAPFRVNGRVTRAGTPVADATLAIHDDHNVWSTNATTAADGTFSLVLWQPGKLHAGVGLHNAVSSIFVDSPALGDDPSEWNIALRDRAIEGRVFDKETNTPVVTAFEVDALFDATAGDATLAVSRAKTADDGTFHLDASKNGEYTVKLHPEGYPASEATAVIRDDSPSARLDFPLSRGVARTLEVVWSSGQPIPNAEIGVVDPRTRAIAGPFATAADGTVEVRAAAGETRTIWISPREGSLAVAHVIFSSASDARPQRVIVAPAAGSLRIRITPKKEMVRFDIAYQGELVPPEIFYAITGANGEAVTPPLPAGVYDLQPIGFAAAPVRATVSAGETVAEIELR
jgi:hypothetical protein